MGPYAIQDISTSGALHLDMLDGEQMTNWLSGCKYHEPLTFEMVQHLHDAKLCQ